MRRNKLLIVIAGLTFLLPAGRLFGQNEDKVVILSPRVGETIDASERSRFKLFQTVENFYEAILYRRPAGSYYARITLRARDGAERDTTIQYSERYLLLMTEQIDHFEELTKGQYKIGDKPATFRIIDDRGEEDIVSGEQKYRKDGPDLLPFAGKTDRLDRQSYPQLAIGISLSTYSPDFSGLSQALTAIEEKYREQG